MHDLTGHLAPGHRWLLFGLVLTASILALVDRQIIAVLKPVIASDLGWTDNDYGSLTAWFQGAIACGYLVTGPIVDRLGIKWSNPLGVIAWSVAAALHGLASGLNSFILCRIALGASEAMGSPAMVKTIATIFPAPHRSLALGLSNAIGSIGAIFTPVLIPLVALLWGWRGAFAAAGALGGVWLLAWLFATRALSLAPNRPIAQAKNDNNILMRPETWTIAVAKCLSDATWWLMLFWMPDYFNRQFGLAGVALGSPLALVYTGSAFGSALAGYAGGRLLTRGASEDAVRNGIMLISAIIVLPVIALVLGTPGYAATIALLALALAGHQGFSASLLALITDVTPAQSVGRMMSFAAFAGNVGGMILSKVAGLVLSAGFGYLPLFVYAALSYFLALGWIQWTMPVIRPVAERA